MGVRKMGCVQNEDGCAQNELAYAIVQTLPNVNLKMGPHGARIIEERQRKNKELAAKAQRNTTAPSPAKNLFDLDFTAEDARVLQSDYQLQSNPASPMKPVSSTPATSTALVRVSGEEKPVSPASVKEVLHEVFKRNPLDVNLDLLIQVQVQNGDDYDFIIERVISKRSEYIMVEKNNLTQEKQQFDTKLAAINQLIEKTVQDENDLKQKLTEIAQTRARAEGEQAQITSDRKRTLDKLEKIETCNEKYQTIAMTLQPSAKRVLRFSETSQNDIPCHT